MRASTYMVRELSKATVEVICSPYPRIIGKIFQNPGDAGMHVTSVARLRLDTTHGTTDWNDQNRWMHDNSWLMTLPFDVDDTGCHMPPFQRSDVSSKHLKNDQDDHLVLNNHTSFTQMLSLLYIYVTTKFFPACFLIPQHLRIFPAYSSPPAWRLQNTGWWHENMAFANATIASLQFWAEDLEPSYPRHSFWTCLQPFLLDFNQPHPMPLIWRSFIWMFLSHIKFSFHPAVVFSRWRLWQWFQQGLTDTLTYNNRYTPGVQYGACILQPCTHYTTPSSGYSSPWHTAFPSQTSSPLPILQ